MVYAGTPQLTPKQLAEKREACATRVRGCLKRTIPTDGAVTRQVYRNAHRGVQRLHHPAVGRRVRVSTGGRGGCWPQSGVTEIRARARSHRHQYAARSGYMSWLFGFTAEIYPISPLLCDRGRPPQRDKGPRPRPSAGELPHRAGHRCAHACAAGRPALQTGGLREENSSKRFVGEDPKHELYLPDVFRDIKRRGNEKWRMEKLP